MCTRAHIIMAPIHEPPSVKGERRRKLRKAQAERGYISPRIVRALQEAFEKKMAEACQENRVPGAPKNPRGTNVT